MKTVKNGYYTQPHTKNIIAVIDNVGYCVSLINGKKIISNERQIFNSYIIEKWDYKPFEN